MACEVCEHCHTPVSREERVTIQEGFSYHRKCHKCYVCSETNLANAEVFKGVIFCSSCAQRIFQGCSTARRTKTMYSGKMKRTRSKSRRRERIRRDRRLNRSRDGVIELAGLVGSTSDSDDSKKKQLEKLNKPSKHTTSTEFALQAGDDRQEHCYYLQNLKKDSTEMGTTTDVTQELLKKINYPSSTCRVKNQTLYAPQTAHLSRRHPRRREHTHNKPICSDLRIAELGASTEIANMTLRKKSEVPVIIISDTRLRNRTSNSLSVLNQESDISGDGRDSLDSYYTSVDESEKKSWMDRRLGSILKLPLKSFKKNILDRSSLISVLSSSTGQNISLIRRIKQLFYEEIAEHQERGVRQLYSCINRKRVPYKLGWVELVKNVSPGIRNTDRDADRDREDYKNKVCKHFRKSHSYRCMRAQVMKLAGPTKSELACFRQKIKRIVAPQFLRNIVHSKKSYPAIKMSQACGSDRRSVRLLDT